MQFSKAKPQLSCLFFLLGVPAGPVWGLTWGGVVLLVMVGQLYCAPPRKPTPYSPLRTFGILTSKVKYGVGSPKFIWAPWAQLYSLAETPQPPPGLWIRIRTGSGFNRVSGSGSGSRREKMTHKSWQKFRNFMFWSAGCSLSRAEGFFCNLDVL